MLVSLCVKIRTPRSENSSGKSRKRLSVPNSQKPPISTTTVEPSRLRLILQRLQDRFYDGPTASEQIAAAVLTDVKDLDESPPALPH
jgi:hypothetical protein